MSSSRESSTKTSTISKKIRHCYSHHLGCFNGYCTSVCNCCICKFIYSKQIRIYHYSSSSFFRSTLSTHMTWLHQLFQKLTFVQHQLILCKRSEVELGMNLIFFSFEKVLFGIQYALPIIILGSTFTRIAVAFRATNEATDSSLKNNHTRAKSKVYFLTEKIRFPVSTRHILV